MVERFLKSWEIFFEDSPEYILYAPRPLSRDKWNKFLIELATFVDSFNESIAFSSLQEKIITEL